MPASRSLCVLRRAVPSGAEALEFVEHENDATRDWQGLVTADGSHAVQRSRKPRPRTVHMQLAVAISGSVRLLLGGPIVSDILTFFLPA